MSRRPSPQLPIGAQSYHIQHQHDYRQKSNSQSTQTHKWWGGCPIHSCIQALKQRPSPKIPPICCPCPICAPTASCSPLSQPNSARNSPGLCLLHMHAHNHTPRCPSNATPNDRRSRARHFKNNTCYYTTVKRLRRAHQPTPSPDCWRVKSLVQQLSVHTPHQPHFRAMRLQLCCDKYALL
jgi:hypothetical protein